MFIFRTIVGKLWITIIALVAIILLALGLFLAKYIETNFYKYQYQTENLISLSSRLTRDLFQHLNEPNYHQLVNELLDAQDAGMIVVKTDFTESVTGSYRQVGKKAMDFFTVSELRQVFAGNSIDNQDHVEHQDGVNGGVADYLAVGVPIKDPQGQIIGAAVVYQSSSSLKQTQFYILRMFAYTSIIGFLLTTFFAFFLLTRITKPLQNLKKAAGLITIGQFGTRVSIISRDELGELSQTFNHMGEKLEGTINELSNEKENLASILRSMTDAVITFDALGNVVVSNPQGDHIIQDWNTIEWTEGTVNTNSENITTVVPEPLRYLFEKLVGESKEEITSKLHVQNEVWSIVMAPLYSPKGVRGAVAVLRNVTEEYRLDKLRKDFVANVSHELRTPISMVQGYSEALLDDIVESPEERKDLVQVIHDESLRLGRLVHDLLDLARMESGHLTMNLREVDVDSLIKRMYRKFTVVSKERKIRLEYELQDEGIRLHSADEDRLEQVLTNLLDNAFRHTQEGARIFLKAGYVEHKSGQAVQLEVSDQGQGIPPEDVPYVFERFYKADKARTRGSSGGTGLGLAIVKNIIDAHQGTVQVISKIGQGTTFSIILPCRLKSK